jgi:hypothetical protein
MSHFIQLFPLTPAQYDVTQYLKPSPAKRDDFTPLFYHCLPLSTANTLGWTLYNPFEFSVTWHMGDQRENVTVECENPYWVSSWFGYATFTIVPGFLVRTSPGINLLIRPVPNTYKPMVQTMEGMIESEWLKGSFTLNFRLKLPRLKVIYKKGEPLVQFVPYPRDLIEQFNTQVITRGEKYDEVICDYEQWGEQRITNLQQQEYTFDQDYMHGKDVDGSIFEEHKRIFKLNKFVPDEGDE